MSLPILAIIGRPNVGKSTLFNRLVGKKLALVDDQPGVTRDRRYAPGSIADLKFQVIDTAGMEEAGPSALATRMFEQTKAAMEEADLLLFVVDVRAGVTPIDEHFAKLVRRSKKPVILVGNKAESSRANAVSDIYSLGFQNIVLLSAEHGEGMGELYEAISGFVVRDSGFSEETGIAIRKKESRKVKPSSRRKPGSRATPDSLPALPEIPASAGMTEPASSKPINLVILGRPNAGKSTLVNALLGEERLLVGPEAGITRDSITIPFDYHGRKFNLVDTAGMRKRANVQGKLEKLAVSDSIRALTYADVVVILIDATAPLEKQDATLAALVEREGRACILGINKWDQIAPGLRKEYLEEIDYLLNKQLSQLHGITVVPVSALKKTGLDALVNACIVAQEVWNKRVSTAALNRWLEGVIAHHSPPLVRGRRLKVKYMTQVKTRPPTFHLHCNMADEFPGAFLKYLTQGLRESFDLHGTPIRLILKESNNPFDKGGRG